MDDTDIASFYVVIQTIPNTISFIACIFLFGFYLSSKNKTLDKKMIFVLSVSDFFLHALTLSVIWIFPLIFTDDGEDGDDDDDENAGLETIINVFLIFPLHFSLFWMGSMSYILMKSLSFEQGSSSNDFSKTNLCVLTLPCTFLTIGVVLGDIQMSSTLLSTILMFFTLIFTVTCYLKSINYLKSLQIQFQQGMDVTIKLLYLNPVSQVLLFTPTMLVLSKYELGLEIMNFLQNVAPVFLGFSGLINTSVYMIQKKVTERRRKHSLFDSEISLTGNL